MLCNKFHAVTKRTQMNPNTMKCTKTWVRGPIGWIRCVRCKKLHCDFIARTFAFIAPVQYILQQVSCSYDTIPDAHKFYKMDWNISLGSIGVDWLRSLWKNPTWLRGTNFCITCSSSPCFASSFKQLRNDPKCTQTLWNTPKPEIRVQWGWIRCFRF